MFAHVLFIYVCCAGVAQASANVFDKTVLHPAIPLVDEDGRHVLDSGKPYSTRMSCGGGSGGCHDIDKIAGAYHFDMGRNEADDRYGADRGVVPVVSPGYFGGFNCMLANNALWLSPKMNDSLASFLDYGAPGLIKTCAGCHNGGGFAEKDRDGNRYDAAAPASIANLDGDYYEWQGGSAPTLWDWQKSGVVEPDCLLCHVDLSRMKNNAKRDGDGLLACDGMDCSLNAIDDWSNLRANMLLKNGHFRDAGSAIFKYFDVSADGEGELFLLSDMTGAAGGDKPVFKWNPTAFDSNGKIEMPMLRFPDNKNCMQCHVTSHQRRGFYGFDEASLVENAADGTVVDDYRDDVHKGKTWTENGQSRDIENCNACHSKQYYKALYLNVDIDADHDFLVGNSDQDVRRDLNFQPGPLSCEHCHGGEAFGGAPNPALPSGHADILSAHRELWKANGDMVGYPANTLNKVVQVHFDVVACQTCHIPDVKHDGADINIRYRYRETEDGRLKMTPYQATPRYYWWDKNNQRIVGRRERLQVSGGDSDPQSYEQVKQVKAALDALLTQKGHANADTQLVWTESNDYLITHNTKPSVLTMPCDDCHERKSNGSVSSLIAPNGVLGEKNKRVVASMMDATAYPRLVDEGVVKLDMPYFQVSGDGKIVENVSDILYETKIEPFLTALRVTSQTLGAGDFKLVGNGEAIQTMGIDGEAAAVAALSGLSKQKAFLFNQKMGGDEIKRLALLVGYDDASKGIVPNYRVEASVRNWMTLGRRVNRKKVSLNADYAFKQGKLKGTISSSVFSFALRDRQRRAVRALGGGKLMLKLPYIGRATAPDQVGFMTVAMEGADVLAKAPTLRPAKAEIVAVKPGTTANYGYVMALVEELPDYGVLIDFKQKKR